MEGKGGNKDGAFIHRSCPRALCYFLESYGRNVKINSR